MQQSSHEKTPACKIFDSWALLALLLGEPAAPRVRAILEQTALGNAQLYMSWINVGEVYYMLARKLNQKAADDFLRSLPALPIKMVLPTEADIVRAARLKSEWRISYADAFAAVLAQSQDASLITGDPEFLAMSSILKVEWLGS